MIEDRVRDQLRAHERRHDHAGDADAERIERLGIRGPAGRGVGNLWRRHVVPEPTVLSDVTTSSVRAQRTGFRVSASYTFRRNSSPGPTGAGA